MDAGVDKVPQQGACGLALRNRRNTTIDGAIEDTVLEAAVSLDNQIQIGTNVRVGSA